MFALALASTLLLAQAKPEAAAPAAPAPVLTVSQGLATPESVLYDAAADQYLVSNINGSPVEKDNNGYITVLAPSGKVVSAKFIAGGQKGVTLDAPKGMGLVKGVLYVADLDTVRMFDRKTGAPKGALVVEGATFLNDIATNGARVFVSDSGLKVGAKGFEPSGTDAVYELKNGKLEAIARGTELGRPNGLSFSQGTLFVVTFGTNELYALDMKGEMSPAVLLPKGSLDGLVDLGKGAHLVSSWEGEAIYRVDARANVTEVLRGLKAPADFAFDSKRKRLLVPRFEENRVEAYELK